MVRSLSFVTAKGELKRIERDRDADVFRAVAVGLEPLGVIVRMTLDVVPAFNLEEVATTLSFEGKPAIPCSRLCAALST